jgi:SAM-dependent methyltransferase
VRTGAFSIGAARRGYRATGISWDERNQLTAERRASACRVGNARFVVGDVRHLDAISTLDETYDVLMCLECIEHILDDRKLFRDMARRLKPGGILLLTTPNYYYYPITSPDAGPFHKTETGWHVRRGYTPAMPTELCQTSGLISCDITYCSGLVSQFSTGLWRRTNKLLRNNGLHWLLTLRARALPLIVPDALITRLLGWPCYSICLTAYKPRYGP